MTDLRELYQEVILDHNRRPRNFGALPAANHRAEGHNPLCGDQVTLFVDVADGTIRDLAFEGSGCAISTASASLMTEALKGRTVDEARALFRDFQELVTVGHAAGSTADLGKLEVFGGVRQYPMRVKCATLPWHTLKDALDRPDST
jgi:nitrogen fixation protein NifU and related proteins